MSASALEANANTPARGVKGADFIALGNALSTDALGLPIQQRAASAWAASEMPTRRTEAWKYTPLK